MNDLLIQRKVYISTIASVSIIFSGLIIYFSIFGMINLWLFNQNPLMQDFSTDGGFDTSQFFFQTQLILFSLYTVGLVFGLFFLVSSIGLKKFKNWGRKIFVLISWIFVIASVALILLYIIFSGEIISQMLQGNWSGQRFNQMEIFTKKMIGFQMVKYGILLVIFVRTLVRIILRFKREEYKTMFD